MEPKDSADIDGEHRRYLDVRTFGSLDGLRALAILAVVWHHSGTPTPGSNISGRGFLGVDLFFVISGFLIVTLLLRERRRTGSISLSKFYVRRALRIAPAYYLMLLLTGSAAVITRGNSMAGILHDLPFACLYLSNLVGMQSMLAITWSLAVEEQFYLIMPALERYLRGRLLFLLPAGYVLVSLPAFAASRDIHMPTFFRETTFGPIILGVMLAHVLDSPAGYLWTRRIVGWRWAPALFMALLLWACGTFPGDISGWPRIAIHWMLTALVASCVVKEQHCMRGALSFWPVRRIGIVSYGIYLYHLLVAHFVLRALESIHASSHSIMFVGLAIATWFVAELSYRLYEARFLALRSRFSVADSTKT